ncbi:hypothetical protein LCGC14_0344570 [marine sediment metagenome]|uniref:Uncharacterized protein n=1 Tax=marine sediment metagenome TaxID=412755 RepID=A0A0F9VZZ2_9ZZZZ
MSYRDSSFYDQAEKIVRSDKVSMEDIQVVIKYIKEIRGDYEVAHSIEADLHVAVLRTIAAGNSSHEVLRGYSRDLATAALGTVELDFPRYYV